MLSRAAQWEQIGNLAFFKKDLVFVSVIFGLLLNNVGLCFGFFLFFPFVLMCHLLFIWLHQLIGAYEPNQRSRGFFFLFFKKASDQASRRALYTSFGRKRADLSHHGVTEVLHRLHFEGPVVSLNKQWIIIINIKYRLRHTPAVFSNLRKSTLRNQTIHSCLV